MKVYLAGNLFNEGEIKQRLHEAKRLREVFPGIDVFNPIEQPFNENKETLPTAIDIYNGDTKHVLEADIIIADITNNDVGVAAELGIAIATGNKLIIAVNSDIRLKTANQYEIPSYSINHYLLGGILKHGYLVYSFEEAIDIIKKSYK